MKNVMRAGMQVWDENDRKAIYLEGLRIRAVAAGAFAALFLVGIQWDWHLELKGYWGVQAILAMLVLINPMLWLIGKAREFPLGDFFVHWFVDISAVAAIVYLLGVHAVPLSPIAFMIMIVSSAAYMTMSAAFYLATLSAIAWSILCVIASRQGVSDEVGGLGIYVPESAEWFLSLSTIVFFFVFAYVAGMVAEKLRRKTLDVLEQRSLLERVLRSEQTARDDMETLSAIVQHDVYGPLSTMRAVIGEVENEYGKPDESVSRELLRLLGSQITSIEAAVESLGLFGASSGDDVVPAGELVGRVLAGLEGMLTERRVSVSCGPIEFKISASPERCYHVIRNLVSNAIKCVPDDGSGRVRIHGGVVGAIARLTIEDNGPGLSEKFIEALTREERVAVRRDRVAEGLGIGIYLSRRLVMSWGGRIEYAGSPLGGAGVSVTFPMKLDAGANSSTSLGD